MPSRVKSKRTAQVRIIGGRWKGRRIPVPGDGVRPTGDRIRETLPHAADIQLQLLRFYLVHARTDYHALQNEGKEVALKLQNKT